VPPEHEVYAVRTGTLDSTRSATYYRYGIYGEADGPLQMDYFFWVLRSEDQTILLDTSFHPDAARRRGREVLVEPLDALHALGIAPDDVDLVVVSHFHYDHVGNLAAFPRARIVAQRKELDFWTGPYARRAQFVPTTEENELDFIGRAWSSGRIEAIDGDAELAPGISARLVGGHCPGQQILLVSTATGTVVLASDALHLYEEMERDMPFEIFSDLEDTYRTYDTLRELEAAGMPIVAGHDPRVMRDFAPVAGPAGEFAVRIG